MTFRYVTSIVCIAALTLCACSSSVTTNPLPEELGKVVDGFQVQLHTNKKKVRAGEPFQLHVEAVNNSAEPIHFWSLTCASGINWWIDNAHIERLELPEDCAANRPVVKTLLPGDKVTEMTRVRFHSFTRPGMVPLRLGFAPWQSKEHLYGRVRRDLPLEIAKKMTRWSPVLALQVEPLAWPHHNKDTKDGSR